MCARADTNIMSVVVFTSSTLQKQDGCFDNGFITRDV